LKNAANAAFCIPMVLGIVFIVALVAGLDINRITLFALILSLGILVDDSIVVVENNARHLAERHKDGRTKKQAILDSVREVGLSIVLSTITRIVSFLGMFAVTGMMGDYMKPIPVFAAIALTASLFVAFSVNPFLAHAFHSEDPNARGHSEEKDSSVLLYYVALLKKFVGRGKRETARRKWLKPVFWISLALVVALPLALDVFRARMLPKADKDQVYLWIDLPRDRSAADSEMAAKLAGSILLDASGSLDSELRVVESVSAVSGGRFLPDFANLFRGSQNRTLSSQSNLRVNLKPAAERSASSEEYVIRVRPILREKILSAFPDATLRLLEDPPGPPTMATFHMKIKGEESLTLDQLTAFAESVEKTVRRIAVEKSVEDLSNTFSKTLPKLRVRLDSERMAERGVDARTVEAVLAAAFSNVSVGTLES
jgi:multidrug efflux pump subunit AcrB